MWDGVTEREMLSGLTSEMSRPLLDRGLLATFH
jgi:hypothetical protein